MKWLNWLFGHQEIDPKEIQKRWGATNKQWNRPLKQDTTVFDVVGTTSEII